MRDKRRKLITSKYLGRTFRGKNALSTIAAKGLEARLPLIIVD